MLPQRSLVALILAPTALFITYLGGIYFTILITAVLLLAAWECTKLMKKIGYQPAAPVILVGVFLLPMSAGFHYQHLTPWLISGLLLVGAGYFTLQFERSRPHPLRDFGGTLIVTLYIGWLGSYLITTRMLPGGMWWMFLIFFIVWMADTGAYLIGTHFGSHQLSPRLSPHKTWEGYFGGILVGTLAGIGFSFLPQKVGAGISFSPWATFLLGLILTCVIPLGDLTGSMFKRIAGVKDSGSLFPGHGGMFDRIDTLLWAMPISQLFIQYIYPTL
jgi:phosphatidate cytidylyltransferase